MTDPRKLLEQIQQRANNGPVSDWDPRAGDEPHHRVIDRTIEFEKRLQADTIALVAALRAVLDELDRCEAVTEEARMAPWSSVRYMPAVAEVSALRNAITEALGGAR